MNGKDFDLVIKPTYSTFYDNSTHVNFKKCEEILRNKLNIPSSEIITFLQLEIYSRNSQSLVNKVEYQAYNENKTIIDLSICNDADIQVFHLINNDSYNLSDYNTFKDKGIDIFNINDEFFNNICNPFSKSKNDLVLKDRIKDIYQNYSICDEDCVYNSINFENKTIACDCKVKTNLSIEEPTLNIIKYNDIKIESNFGIIKCYKLVFSFNGKLTNIGFWIFLILVITHIPLLFYYFCKGIKPIKDYLLKEMISHGYIKVNKQQNKKAQKNPTNILNPPKNKKNLQLKDSSSINNLKASEREEINIINNDIKKNNKKENGRKKRKKKNKKEINKPIMINNVIFLKKPKKRNMKKKKSKKISNLPTQGNKKIQNKKNKKVIIKEKAGEFNLNLININLNNIKDYTPKSSSHILNIYSFEEAIKYDMRSICLIFYIFLLSKQAAFHAFLFKSPLETFQIRFCLLLFIISSDLALNAIFYLDDKISKKYRSVQNLFLFTFNNNITIILISTFIGFLFLTLFTNLSNSTNKIRDVFRQIEEKIKKNKKFKVTEKMKKDVIIEIEKILNKHRIKVVILILIEFSLLLFFWYYVTAFCHVYASTQMSWILDSLLSMLSRLIFELLLSLGFAKLYRIGVESNVYCIYKISLFFYNFG